ncbi:MAG TPA: prepilin-type N-terminal cleavage/methylation domain-containing protein [Desulfosporosinus sp.]|nr:prepilin-type N-terminal cleavage/methylation domain-containing protein [Desulfosporosinus sp.]
MFKRRGFTPLEIKIPNREDRKFLTGFTLIELLMVISIVVLLMALLLPALQRVRRQAGAVACKSNLHQWAVAFSMYIDDNGGAKRSITRKTMVKTSRPKVKILGIRFSINRSLPLLEIP